MKIPIFALIFTLWGSILLGRQLPHLLHLSSEAQDHTPSVSPLFEKKNTRVFHLVTSSFATKKDPELSNNQHIFKNTYKKENTIAKKELPKHNIAIPTSWKTIKTIVTAYLIQHNQDDPGRPCPVYNNRTADGSHIRPGIVAVDTKVFPFGTQFHIPGYGRGSAHDTGGMIIGKHIDLAVTSCKFAHQWGIKHMVVAYQSPE